MEAGGSTIDRPVETTVGSQDLHAWCVICVMSRYDLVIRESQCWAEEQVCGDSLPIVKSERMA
jgi:hypothetical protein